MHRIVSFRNIPTRTFSTSFVPLTQTTLRHFSTGRKYTSTHEWVDVDSNGVGTVGISDFAQKALGDVVYVDLPNKGRKVSQTNTFGAVESVKAASDVYSPVSGDIVDVNSKLTDQPGLVNESPFRDGWMIKVKLNKQDELKTLLDEKAYEEHCKNDKH
eukprot:TRINITY_DN8303_c0_g1_i1.p1 TRINITY_DN8303_c0_g1~~TRINITY_DN8303_c0_g1_i1.p1  ORF type:complete len:158 (+),score=28.42 TRINITY_DN8303_c0_g1_i1:84-557(+)